MADDLSRLLDHSISKRLDVLLAEVHEPRATRTPGSNNKTTAA